MTGADRVTNYFGVADEAVEVFEKRAVKERAQRRGLEFGGACLGVAHDAVEFDRLPLRAADSFERCPGIGPGPKEGVKGGSLVGQNGRDCLRVRLPLSVRRSRRPSVRGRSWLAAGNQENSCRYYTERASVDSTRRYSQKSAASRWGAGTKDARTT